MSRKLLMTTLAGAVALGLGGTASAETFLPSNNGALDLYLNVVDYTISTSTGQYSTDGSYLADLGITAASFNPNQSYTWNLASDSNWSSLAKSGTLDFSIVGATHLTGTEDNKYSIYTTAGVSPSPTYPTESNEQGAITLLETAGTTGFLYNAGTSTNSITTGAYTVSSKNLTTGGSWGNTQYEATWSGDLLNNTIAPYGDNASIGSHLGFYLENGTYGTTTPALTVFGNGSGTGSSGGYFNLTAAGLLTWTPGTTTTGGGTAVPLPTPLVLLLSGLGLMGVVARRGKAPAGGLAV